MQVDVRRVEYSDIVDLRDLYRAEANCQIKCDSILRRGMADPYLVLMDGRVAGYGGVWNKYDVGRVMEFYVLPAHRTNILPLFREFVAVSQATQIEAQTNMPTMLMLLYDCAENIVSENILFYDAFTSHMPCPDGAIFRRITPADKGPDPDAAFGLEVNGTVIASGGFLTHYNPPYGDIYMAVAEPMRQKGFGSYFVQEAKRVCYEAGRRPAARCNVDNIASRRTLQKAGLLPCGRLLAGSLKK